MSKRKRTAIGRELAKLRIDFSETAGEMAEKLEMSSSNLFNAETGNTTVTFDLILKVKEVYGKDLEELFISGGGLSKVVLELDELSEEDKALAINLWCKCKGIEPPKKGPVDAPKADPDPEPVDKRPPPLPDDVGFIMTDAELEELDDV